MRLDDPSFPAPIFANLIADPETGLHTLIWSRPKAPARADKRPQSPRQQGRGGRLPRGAKPAAASGTSNGSPRRRA